MDEEERRQMTTRAGDRWSEEGRDTESEGNILNEKCMEILQSILLSHWGGEFVWAGQDTGGGTSGHINPKYSVQYLSSCAVWSPERQVSPRLELGLKAGLQLFTFINVLHFGHPFLSLSVTVCCKHLSQFTQFTAVKNNLSSLERQGVIFNISQKPDAGRNNWTASYFTERAYFFFFYVWLTVKLATNMEKRQDNNMNTRTFITERSQKPHFQSQDCAVTCQTVISQCYIESDIYWSGKAH